MHRARRLNPVAPSNVTQVESRPRPRLYAQHLSPRPFAEPGEPRLHHVPKALKSALSIVALAAIGWVVLTFAGRFM